MKSLEEARRIVLSRFAQNSVETQRVATPDAVGRVLAEPVTARLSSPNFHAAAMDGIAVNAADTFGAHETRPKDLSIGKQAFYVNTGHVMPSGIDAVIMIEHVQEIGNGQVRIEAPAFPWQHVRKMGEDIVATEMLFARRHRITPYCVGALLSAGVFEVCVFAQPRVLILPTGSELVDFRTLSGNNLRPGQVIESNSYVLSELVRAAGGNPLTETLSGDELDAIAEKVRNAVAGDAHLVMILGGSSAGSEDFARAVIDRIGEIFVHGVTMMPGKPVIAGQVAGKPVFGIPGYPVSAIMACEQLVQPLIAHMLGLSEAKRPEVAVVASRKIASRLGVEEFVRVKIGQVGERLVATQLPRGSGCITSITEADGIIRIPAQVEGIKDNTPVNAELLRDRRTLANTIVVVGSHDNTLDVLADELRAQCSHLSLSSSHVGSMGGLMAIKRGVCHMAGAHLLDENDGSYNLSYIRRYLPDTPVKLVHLVKRDQGLMVLAGNPKKIKGIEDLVRSDVRLINRQAGSGTRILLDYKLRQMGLDAQLICGYNHEEFTHMAVAVAILSKAADVGLGIHAAAAALGLEFIPVVTEQYDLVISKDAYDSDAVQAMLSVINSTAFKQRVSALGGYHVERTGEVLL
jgi:putative molybdopterin biosynthesis protein